MTKKYLKMGLVLFILAFCLIGCKKEDNRDKTDESEVKQETQIDKNNSMFKSERLKLIINDNDIMFPGTLKDFFCIVEFDDKYLEKDVKDTEEAIGLVKGYYDTEIEFVMINKKEGAETPIQDCHVSEVIVKKDPNNKFELPKEVTMANTYKEVLETYGNPNMNDEKDGERIVVYMNVKNNYSIMMKFEKEKMTEIRLTSMLH